MGNKLYFFEGRNTAVVAPSAKVARKQKRRGGNRIVQVLEPSSADKKAIAAGRWVRTRRDGKPPSKSRYGKGRGKGPPRRKRSKGRR